MVILNNIPTGLMNGDMITIEEFGLKRNHEED